MKLSKVANLFGGSVLSDKKINRVITDSRKVEQGDLFIPIVGANFDGHNYLEEAVKKGAIAVLSSKKVNLSVPVFYVDDTVKAFGDIARLYKNESAVKLVAVTGSVGKTSTKELIYNVLSKKGKTLKNIGNFNNEIGLPATLVRLDESYDYAVVELGMNHLGEIDYLASVCEPDIAVITNIGTSHIGMLGSRYNIYKAKMEVLPHIKTKTVIVYGDDDYLKKIEEENIKVIKYGKSNSNDIRLISSDIVKGRFNAESKRGTYDVEHHLNGEHLVLNSLAAISVGEIFEVSKDDIISAISDLKMTDKRMNLINYKDMVIIDDCYNASYESVKAAIDYCLQKSKEGKCAFILGDIFELGEHAKRIHEELGELVSTTEVDRVFFVGSDIKHAYDKALEKGFKEAYYYKTKDEFIDDMEKLQGMKMILVKASRAMEFEKIIEGIRKR